MSQLGWKPDTELQGVKRRLRLDLMSPLQLPEMLETHLRLQSQTQMILMLRSLWTYWVSSPL